MRSKFEPSGRDTFLGRARREQILGCAIDALAETGFAGTSLAEVAKRAGVAKSVVSYHFAARSTLLEAVVAKVYADAAPDLESALAAAIGERARLAAYIRGCTEFAWTHRRACRALDEVFRNLRTDDGSLRFTAADSAELIGFVRGILTAGQRSGEFGEFDANTLAITLRAAIDALPGAFDADPTLTGPETAEHLVHIFDTATRARTRTGRGKGRKP